MFRNFVHFGTNSWGDDFCNARLPSRGWCIPRRVGSDLWYRDMIACGAVAFSRRTGVASPLPVELRIIAKLKVTAKM